MRVQRDRLVMMTDSKSMPRPGVPVEVTYPFLVDEMLRERLGAGAPNVVVRAKRGRMTRDVLEDFTEDVEYLKPRVLFIDSNGVECVPRIFMPWQGKLVFSIPVVRGIVQRGVRKHRRRIILALGNRTYVRFPQFTENVRQLMARIDAANVPYVVFMGGIVPRASVERRTPGFGANMRQYNGVLRDLADGQRVFYVDSTEHLEASGRHDDAMADDVHPNELGHEIIARAIADAVAPLFEAAPERAAEAGPGAAPA